ncbi:DUF1690 domain-containing protein [Cordyceps fumosorosea ARSEF 2679]|uniref:DUF1690 domain-containing protein n=1 Tax=Cordyceps fumosorosea (strain ARSEF 2679) TaxID=1081104 RepID=A0A167TKE3_CORFA|nr:DUF1690 domain-containing protein [Cordyceps fumosorosea ARSEF 2679]OAA60690.1 DUF1690 domain-containing protein [Cordyceps fumosorosea ARSEF 2679]
MGSSTSKPEQSGYQWKASGTPGVSMPVLDSLQSSPETDASRAKLLEQQVHARVAEELKKLQKREAEALAAAHDKIASAAPSSDDATTTNRFTVGKEVDALRKKLEERKQVRALPEEVERARGRVVECLRVNDRRPLDCWQEVEDFKAEVQKLERSWVDKVVS